MATNVTFTRLARADLGELVEAAADDDPQAYLSFLAANGTSVADYDWDGDAFRRAAAGAGRRIRYRS